MNLEDRQKEMRERMLTLKLEAKTKKLSLKSSKKEPEIVSRVCELCKKNEVLVEVGYEFIPPCRECCRRKLVVSKYDLTIEDFYAMLAAQKGKCAICNKKFHIERADRLGKIHIDHCHALGHVRGLLCRGCNVGLGFFKEDRLALKNAIKYLTENAFSREWCANVKSL